MKGKSWSKKAGDKLERIGEKLTRRGRQKVGKTIYDLGNKLEHKDDKKVK